MSDMIDLLNEIRKFKQTRNAVILAHTYQPGEVQDIADFVGDSYQLSVEAARTQADVIIFCGVRFMAETASILNPARTVILPDPDAGCPMADMIRADDLIALKQQYPDHLVLCYVNTNADIKALSDICVTSSNAETIVRKIDPAKGIIFVPDKHLGDFVSRQTGRSMILWRGFCPTHARIKPAMITDARKQFPGAKVLIHPEAPWESRQLADAVLSTGGMCSFVQKDPGDTYIIATEEGIIHTLKKQNPGKRFISLSSELVCPNMKKMNVEKVYLALDGRGGMIVKVEPDVAKKARESLTRMLEMS